MLRLKQCSIVLQYGNIFIYLSTYTYRYYLCSWRLVFLIYGNRIFMKKLKLSRFLLPFYHGLRFYLFFTKHYPCKTPYLVYTVLCITFCIHSFKEYKIYIHVIHSILPFAGAVIDVGGVHKLTRYIFVWGVVAVFSTSDQNRYSYKSSSLCFHFEYHHALIILSEITIRSWNWKQERGQ